MFSQGSLWWSWLCLYSNQCGHLWEISFSPVSHWSYSLSLLRSSPWGAIYWNPFKVVDIKEKSVLTEITGLGRPKSPQGFQRKDNSGNWPGNLLYHYFSVSLLNYCWTLTNALASYSLSILYNFPLAGLSPPFGELCINNEPLVIR